MLALEAKQYGDRLLHHSDLWGGGVFLGETSRSIQREMKIKDEVTGEWRRLHKEELNDLYSSPNIVRVIKSRRMRWVGYVTRMGEEKGGIRSWLRNWRERDHWRDLCADGWIILRRISRRWDVGIWTGLGWPRIEIGGGRLWVR